MTWTERKFTYLKKKIKKESTSPGNLISHLKIPIVLYNARCGICGRDGSCVNSDHIHFEMYRETLVELVPSYNDGQPITREQYDTTMAGRQNPELVASILPDMSERERTALWQTKERRYEHMIGKGVPPIIGLTTLLENCAKHGLTTMVVTNAPKGSCTKTLNAIGVAPHFGDRIVVAEDCSKPKPDAAPYLRALQVGGVAADVAIAFEDSPSGTMAAVAAGVYTIGIRSTQSDKALCNAGAAFTIQDYTDVRLLSFLSAFLD